MRLALSSMQRILMLQALVNVFSRSVLMKRTYEDIALITSCINKIPEH